MVVDGSDGSPFTGTVFNITLQEVTSAAVTSGVTSVDFSSAVTFTITAEDGTTTEDWTITVTSEAILGNDIMTNGDMSSSTGWTLNAGWAIVGGQLVGTAAATTAYQQPGQTLATYRITIVVDEVTSGIIEVRDSEGNTTGNIISAGTHIFDVEMQSYVIIDGSNASPFTGKIDSISVVLVSNTQPPPIGYLFGEVGEVANSLEISFTEPLVSGKTDGTHSLSTTGAAVTLSSPSISAEGILILTISRDITESEVLHYSYVNSGANPLTGLNSGVEVQDITSASVTNNVTEALFGPELIDFAQLTMNAGWSESNETLSGVATTSTAIFDLSLAATNYRVNFTVWV